MKNWEVAIIVVVIAVIAYSWWKNHTANTQTANPTNATTPGYKMYGPIVSGRGDCIVS